LLLLGGVMVVTELLRIWVRFASRRYKIPEP
jgi:hypothetical protein